jgi:hypothetical protein
MWRRLNHTGGLAFMKKEDISLVDQDGRLTCHVFNFCLSARTIKPQEEKKLNLHKRSISIDE